MGKLLKSWTAGGICLAMIDAHSEFLILLVCIQDLVRKNISKVSHNCCFLKIGDLLLLFYRLPGRC